MYVEIDFCTKEAMVVCVHVEGSLSVRYILH